MYCFQKKLRGHSIFHKKMLVREQPLLCVAAKMDVCYAIYIGNKYISTKDIFLKKVFLYLELKEFNEKNLPDFLAMQQY